MGWFAAKPDVHGGARWADAADLERGKFFKAGGVALGITRGLGRRLYWNGEGHILTVAPPGSGKTTALIIPNLLSYDRGSLVITDPKGTLTAQTARHRREVLKNRVVVLNPWRDEIRSELGVDLGETGFNPLAILRAGDPAVIDNAETIANLLCPTPPNARESFFTKTGAQVLTGCLLFLCHSDRHDCTLPALFEFIRTTREGWKKIAAEMISLGKPDLSAYAGEILSNIESEKQWSGVLGSMSEATQIYNPDKALGRHVERNEFDPDDLKRDKVTVYVVIPSNRRVANKAWLALVMSVMAEAVGRPSKSAPVLLVAEEFANLGYMPTIKNAMAEYREAGLKVHLVIQNLPQLRSIYGNEGAEEIEANCNVRQYFAVSDHMVARKLEEQLGTYTHVEENEHGIITRKQPVPLMRAQDILNMKPYEQLILTTGQTPPIFAHLRPYYRDGRHKRRADPNPLRDDAPLPEPLLSRLLAALPFDLGKLRLPLLAFALVGLLLAVWLVPAAFWGWAFLASVAVGLAYVVFWWKPLPDAFWYGSRQATTGKDGLISKGVSLFFRLFWIWLAVVFLEQLVRPDRPLILWHSLRWVDQTFGTSLLNWWFF